jgi:hypothetical protein
MALRLLVTFSFVALLIYLGSYHSVELDIYSGLGIVGVRFLYLLSTKRGRNLLYGNFFWGKMYKKYRNLAPIQGASINGSGQLGQFSYLVNVTTNEKGVVLQNLSSARKRDINIPWEEISTIDVWKNENDNSVYAKATFSNETMCEHFFVPWSTENNCLVPSSVGMSGLQ